MTLEPQHALTQLCRALIADPEVIAIPDWCKLVMVGSIQHSSKRMFGFCFDRDGQWEAAAPRLPGTLELLRQLRSSMQACEPERRAWLSCLLLISTSGSVECQIEFLDPARWSISPSTHASRVEEFRQLAFAMSR